MKEEDVFEDPIIGQISDYRKKTIFPLLNTVLNSIDPTVRPLVRGFAYALSRFLSRDTLYVKRLSTIQYGDILHKQRNFAFYFAKQTAFGSEVAPVHRLAFNRRYLLGIMTLPGTVSLYSK